MGSEVRLLHITKRVAPAQARNEPIRGIPLNRDEEKRRLAPQFGTPNPSYFRRAIFVSCDLTIARLQKPCKSKSSCLSCAERSERTRRRRRISVSGPLGPKVAQAFSEGRYSGMRPKWNCKGKKRRPETRMQLNAVIHFLFDAYAADRQSHPHGMGCCQQPVSAVLGQSCPAARTVQQS